MGRLRLSKLGCYNACFSWFLCLSSLANRSEIGSDCNGSSDHASRILLTPPLHPPHSCPGFWEVALCWEQDGSLAVTFYPSSLLSKFPKFEWRVGEENVPFKKTNTKYVVWKDEPNSCLLIQSEMCGLHWIWSLFLTTLPLRVVQRGHVSTAQPLWFGFLLLCFLKSLRKYSLDQDPRSQAFTVLCSMYSGISSCLGLSPAWEPNREISLCIFQCTKGGPRILVNCPSTFRDWTVEWYLHCLGAEKELEPLYEKNRIFKKIYSQNEREHHSMWGFASFISLLSLN